MIVKGNQGTLAVLIELLLAGPLSSRVAKQQVKTGHKGHGRLEWRTLTSSEVLAGKADFPGLQQIFRLKRQRQGLKTGKREEEVVLGITSVGAKEAGPRQLLRWARGHWQIENRSHWVRDVTYREDLSQVQNGTIAQLLAALRNTAIGLMRLAGQKNIARATRYYAAKPWEALALIGCSQDF